MSTAEIILVAIAIELGLIAYMLRLIYDRVEGPRETIEEDPESIRRRLAGTFAVGSQNIGARTHDSNATTSQSHATSAAYTATSAEDSATDAVEEEPERMVFGGMPEEVRRARRRARRIENCMHTAVHEALPKLDDAQTAVACAACTGVADIIREEGKHPRLGEFT
jgi:hypothetical protein